MSISFTPSQLHVIQLVTTEAEFMRGGEYVSFAREGLSNLFNEPPALYPSSFGVVWTGDARERAIALWREKNAERERKLESCIILIDRAYERFRKEFDHYTAKRCGIRAVRQYHRLLVDTLAPFTK